jgi:hypothetical protein
LSRANGEEKKQVEKEEEVHAEYLIQSLDEELTAEFGGDYSQRNLETKCKCYMA